MKGVFDTSADTTYDDEITTRYHFGNRQYLQSVEACRNDWIIYREPRRGGRNAYVAAARVVAVEPDPKRSTHSYARLEGYLEFDRAVPLDGPAGP